MSLYIRQLNNIKKMLIFGSVFFILLLPIKFIFAEEKINNFDSQITINPDASILVTETINYDFSNLGKHGIYRYIPVYYRTPIGSRSISLEIQSVTLDGESENYVISILNENQSIKIGKTEGFVTGEHTYKIVYKVRGAINYSKDVDELYWNVTGDKWQVPVENVSVSINLPTIKTGKVDLSCYEGILGSNEKCLTEIKDNIFTAKSTRVLQAGDGLTIAADFPRGVVYQPTLLENVINFIKNNFVILIPFLVCIVMFFIWRKKGKDPKGYSVIIAQYEPPMNMKPTLVGSLVDEKPDYRDITAGFIYLAEQGFLKIKRLEKQGLFGSVDYEFELLKNDVKTLESTEKNILNLFFEDDLTIGSIKKISDFKSNLEFSGKVKILIDSLYQEMTNRGFFVKNPSRVKVTYIITSGIFVIFGMFLFSVTYGIVGIISILVSGVIILVWGMFMGKKTKLGAEMKDYILGFKLFLSVTEKDRLDFHNAPEKSPEQFMQFLPYAIALGVENKWAEQFKDIYMENPQWYNSNVSGTFIVSSFMLQMSDFSKSVNTGMAYVSQSAASGGLGGSGAGFSGGGFGGGGGGSW